MVSLLQFGPFRPHRLLNGADAKRACIAVHIPLHHICCLYHPPLIYPFTFHHLGFSPHAYLSSSSFGGVSRQGFMLSTFSLTFSRQRDTCCCILFLCRIAEFSCFLNLLTTLDYFIPVLFLHIFTHPHCTFIHSHLLHSFPSFGSWFLSPHNTCTHALNFRNDKSH
jgi:hypothetical protein